MIQRILGLVIGGLVTFVLLIIIVLPKDNPNLQDFIAPLVIGNVAAFFWPVVIGFWLARRVKQRREDQINQEVARQIDQERRG